MFQQAAFSPHRSTYWPRRPRFVQQPPASVSKRHGADRRCRRIPMRSTGAKNERVTVFSTTPPPDGSPRSVSVRVRNPASPPAAPPLASYLTPNHHTSLPFPATWLNGTHTPRHTESQSHFPVWDGAGLGTTFPPVSQDGVCVFSFLSTVLFVVLLLLLPPR